MAEEPHYFQRTPAVSSAPLEITVRVAGLEFPMLTDRGVFSHGALDRGTAILLEQANQPPAEGDLCDLGCGAGAIALSLAMRSPKAMVWAIDTNDRALDLCAANAARLGLDNLRTSRPEEVPITVVFQTIWSNPPIRIGKAKLHELLRLWLSRLVPDGEAWLVVHRHLGSDSLQRWLNEQHWPTVRHHSESGYRILRVTSDSGRIDSDS